MAGHKRQRSGDFLLASYVDFRGDVEFGVYTPGLLDEMMARYRRMGVRRVYWWYDGDVDPQSDWYNGLINLTEYGPATLENIGDPVTAAAASAHRHGVELYGILYPYSLGASNTCPEGSPEAQNRKVKRVGGRLQIVSRFIERYPHLRVQRRPVDLPGNLTDLPVRKIRLINKDDTPTRIKKENLQIWTSVNNYRYQRRDVEFTLRQGVERAPGSVHDRYGQQLTGAGDPVRVLTLEGLDLADPFVLITTDFQDDRGNFRNTAQAMVEVYGLGDPPLPIEVATRRAIMPFPRDFREYGLEFDCGIGLSQVTLDMDNTALPPAGGVASWRNAPAEGVIAFARGRNEYVPADPCEAYPKVQQLWTGWVQRMLEAGADGIDIRLGSHGIGTSKPYEYGFNEPIVEAYRHRYGTNPLADDVDLAQLAEIRAELFTAFVRQTSHQVRGAGRKLQMHLTGEGYPLRPDPSRMQPFWSPANIYFDYKQWLSDGLLDGMTLRADPDEPFVAGVMQLARQSQVPIYVNRYLTAMPIEDYVAEMETIFDDDGYAGLTVYEHQNLARAVPDGSRLVPFDDTVASIRNKAKQLGLV